MPFYDFKCDECEKIVEEFFKIADNKYIECCGIQMKQVFLKVSGVNKPHESGPIRTKGGIYMKDVKSGSLRKVGDPPTVGK